MNENDPEVPTEAQEILHFWFKEIDSKRWFNSDRIFDSLLRSRFGELNEQGARGELDHWMKTASGALALIILLDQMSRNMHRGTKRAFAQDAKALELAEQAITAGFDRQSDAGRRAFFYMPHMHCEDLDTQNRCVDLITERLGADSGNLPHATWHRGVVENFGRFPFRNAALGRDSTPEEVVFLKSENVPG